MGQHDPLLVSTLEGMRESIDKIGDAVTNQTAQIAVLDERMQNLEKRMLNVQSSVKKEARKWGAVGGAATGLAGIVAALAKLAFIKPS